MPRKARSIYRGEYYHILSRGNNRQTIFLDRKDFQFYLRMLHEYIKKYDVSVFHYCLMKNHTHFLMRSESSNRGITRVMHGLQLVYAIYFQKRHKKTGHIFEDRFKSFHIENESYLFECGRYIERNPVRAGIATNPAMYPWSSLKHYVEGRSNSMIKTNPLYLALSDSQKERQKSYCQYIKSQRAYEVIVDKYFDERVLI